jgi:hypothetical protein
VVLVGLWDGIISEDLISVTLSKLTLELLAKFEFFFDAGRIIAYYRL